MTNFFKNFKNFIEQHSDTKQFNMRYNIKYNTENDELNRNSIKNTFDILWIYTSQKKKRYTSFYFYNIFNANNILW